MLVDRFRDSPTGVVVPIQGFDPRFGEEYDHWAFLPNPLPNQVQLSNETWTAVNAASLSLGRLDQAGRQIPNPVLLRRPTLRKEAQSTSALEGTYAPLAEVLQIDPDDLSRRSPQLAEVLNYVQAAEHAFESITDRPLTLQLVLEIHRLLVVGTASDHSDAGCIRDHQVVIGPPSTRVSKARFVPPPPGPELKVSLQAWIDWVNTDLPLIPPVVAVALAHYQFETIHPFNDGNGRIGRLFIVVQLLRREIIREPLLSVSPWFEARRSEYQDELLRVSEIGDFDRWVRYFSHCIRDQADDTIRRIDELLMLHNRFREVCQTRRIRGTALSVAQGLIGRPIINPTWVQKHYGVSYPTANSAVARLVELGLVRETTGGKYGRVFVAEDVLQVLSR